MEDLRKFINQRLESEGDPNKLTADIEEIIEEWATKNGWSHWGDGEWRIDAACSICGSSLPGICGHERDPNQIVLTGIAATPAAGRDGEGA